MKPNADHTIMNDQRHLPVRPQRVDMIWYKLSWMGWVLTAILFMIDPLISAIPIVTVLSMILSFPVIMRTPKLGLYLLPLPIMIGPICSVHIYGIGHITSGDLYSATLIIRSLFLHDTKDLGSEKKFLFVGVALLLISSVFSFDIFSSFVGLSKILQYALLIRITVILIKKLDDFRKLFNAWTYTTTICAIIMLWHFYCGRPYLIFWLNDMGIDYSMNLMRSDVFFRPTYFYSNIFVPIGLSLTYALTTMFQKDRERSNISLLLMTIPINFVALIINNIRSMVVPVVILGVLVLMWHFWDSYIREKLKLRKIILTVLLIGLGTWFFFGTFVGAPQRIALIERVYNSESLISRLSMWKSVSGKILDNPFRLLIGWGPQSTTRQLDQSPIKDLLSRSLGNAEGAFDSTIIGSIVEYGLIFSTIIFTVIMIRFLSMIHNYRINKNVYTHSILLMASVLIVCHVFQQFSINPPGLMALQVFAIEPVLKNRTAKS